ncbi:MAG: tol-pal system protein YbgF [Myxococcota bacterium]|nr:tol-pal system protein YbgF [Myxococcota bacterium]
MPRWGSKAFALIVAAVLVVFASGCVTVAEHRKLEKRVKMMERGRSSGPQDRGAFADTNAEIDRLRQELSVLRGRVEVAEKTAVDAAADARRARQDLADQTAVGGEISTPADEAPLASEEVRAYRAAHALWRTDDVDGCIDQFAVFLQKHPGSTYADDAAYWRADCYFKKGEFDQAVLRFDDVVRKYPEGNKAPDALFREGEALLKLGHSTAANQAFKRVVSEYPESSWADEARKRLEIVAEN